MAREFLAVIGIKQLVTLAGPNRPRVGAEMWDLGILDDAVIIVEDGLIMEVGTRLATNDLIPSHAEVVDAGGRLVTPGLIDAHTHAVFAGNRTDDFEKRCAGATYQQIADDGGGIQSTVAKTRAATEAELVDRAKRHAAWFLRNGTTTIEAKSGYGLTLEDELKLLRAIRRLGQETALEVVPTVLAAHAVPKECRLDEWVRLVQSELLPRVKEEGLAEFCDVFCEEGYFDLESSRGILTTAKELGFGLRIHADQLTNCGGAKLAAELGAMTADHLEQTDSEGIRALRCSGVQPVLLPGSVFALGHAKYPAAREMIDSGLAVVLATDFNPGSSPTPSLPLAMSLACTQMSMTPAEALSACTVNAAYSLNRGHDRGSLEKGKRGDFVVWDAEDWREIPYWTGVELASKVFVRGRPALQRVESTV